MLEVRLLYGKLEKHNSALEETVRERTAELRESEARYRSLTELASDWYWEQDETGTFTKVPARSWRCSDPRRRPGGCSGAQEAGRGGARGDARDHRGPAALPRLRLSRVKADGSLQNSR